MEELSYRIDDKTIVELLGNQNFTSYESAVLELVKNAYDAKATTLVLQFDNETLSVADNGTGMNADDIRTHWMHVGFSDKGYEILDDHGRSRVLSGSKGIGRFALSKLGTAITIYSKRADSTAIIWETDWEKSSLTEDSENQKTGTRIIIGGLRQKWTQKKVLTLKDFLSRTFHDDSMDIIIRHPDFGEERVNDYFPKAGLGINCLSVIRLNYDAREKTLITNIVSDEFSDEARIYCKKADIHQHTENNEMFVELRPMMKGRYSGEELSDGLETLGDFSAELYFVNHPTKEDVNKFCYKHDKLPETMSEGIILYRNAFSISSFDGKKDWLGLGKRSRKSPASPSHETGSWRVRENQISGKVEIDKRNNAYLKDMSNRQGLEENFQYHLFIDILLTGLGNFERYRQGIIRQINVKNKKEIENIESKATPIADRIMVQPSYLAQISSEEATKLAQEITVLKEARRATNKEKSEIENQYRYDVRILNVLSTIGLKAASIAHEMRNDRNAIQYNVEYTIKALQEYGMWEELSDPDHTALKFKSVPQLLNDDKRVSKKLVSFMDTMLADVQKKKFIEPANISACVERICKIWERDYAWVRIQPTVDDAITIQLHEDVIQVVLDNLILNSIQQNEKNKDIILFIDIRVEQNNGFVRFTYKDNGKGLDPKYESNPRKILEVHETTRPEGHGLGMWIVNNTVTMTGGEIISILPGMGFTIEFSMGGVSE